MKHFIFICLLMNSAGSFGQNYQVINRQKEGVPFATVYDIEKETGTVADENGYFFYAAGTKVIMSSIGYSKDTVILKQCKNVCQHILEVDIREMNQVLVFSEEKKWKDTFKAGFTEQERNVMVRYMNSPYGQTLLTRIDNPNKRPAKLLKAYFDIRNNGKTKIRVRIFSVGKDGRPGYDLLTETVFVEGGNYLTLASVNLNDYNIIIPENGIFVGIDLFKTSTEDLFFKIGKVGSVKPVSYTGNLQKSDTLYLHTMQLSNNVPSYMVDNYRFGIKAAY